MIYTGGGGEYGGGVSVVEWELGDVKIARSYVSDTRKYEKYVPKIFNSKM